MTTEFFTWANLASYAGATLFVTLVTQYVKQITWLEKLPTQVISYIVAVLTLLLATQFTVGLTLENGLLCVVNALVVSTAANGTYDNITDFAGKEELK